jgi:hypothetical protein
MTRACALVCMGLALSGCVNAPIEAGVQPATPKKMMDPDVIAGGLWVLNVVGTVALKVFLHI